MMYRSDRHNSGLTLIELMTVLVIIMLMAMVGFPTYQEYQNRAYLAEAESVVGTMERHLRTYFLNYGSFYSASPEPATVPGLASLGDTGSFTVSGGWAVLGSPVAGNSGVNFSYQAFAGQTPSGSTTPTTNDYLNSPTDNMNLVRRVATSSYHYEKFQNPVRVSYAEPKLRFDSSEFGACSFAATQEDLLNSCISACRGDETCIQACNARYGSDEDGRDGVDGRNGNSDVDACTAGCMAEDSRRPESGCRIRCEVPADGQCTSGYDIDCYTTDESGRRLPMLGEDCVSSDGSGFCPANNAGGSSGGGESGGDESGGGETDEGEYSGGGGGGGGPESDDGDHSDDNAGTSEGSNAECAAFGVSRPIDFGIQENVENYNWVVMTAIGNFSSGTECTLVAKVLQTFNGATQQTDFIKANVGE